MTSGVVDFSALVTAIQANLEPAVDAALPIAGLILAIGIGLKLFRRFVK